MSDATFPQVPSAHPLRPTPVVQVVPRNPLEAIREILSVSVHDVINDASKRRLVAEFYRITRWIERETWLQRELRSISPPGPRSGGG